MRVERMVVILVLVLSLFCSAGDLLSQVNHCEKERVVSFVTEWFSLFDQEADVQKFIERIVTNRPKFQFPEATLNSTKDFENWYSSVRKMFVNPSHEVRSIDVKKSPADSFIVEVVVIWRAINKDTQEHIRFNARQVWEVLDVNNTLKIKSYFVEEDKILLKP